MTSPNLARLCDDLWEHVGFGSYGHPGSATDRAAVVNGKAYATAMSGIALPPYARSNPERLAWRQVPPEAWDSAALQKAVRTKPVGERERMVLVPLLTGPRPAGPVLLRLRDSFGLSVEMSDPADTAGLDGATVVAVAADGGWADGARPAVSWRLLTPSQAAERAALHGAIDALTSDAWRPGQSWALVQAWLANRPRSAATAKPATSGSSLAAALYLFHWGVPRGLDLTALRRLVAPMTMSQVHALLGGAVPGAVAPDRVVEQLKREPGSGVLLWTGSGPERVFWGAVLSGGDGTVYRLDPHGDRSAPVGLDQVPGLLGEVAGYGVLLDRSGRAVPADEMSPVVMATSVAPSAPLVGVVHSPVVVGSRYPGSGGQVSDGARSVLVGVLPDAMVLVGGSLSALRIERVVEAEDVEGVVFRVGFPNGVVVSARLVVADLDSGWAAETVFGVGGRVGVVRVSALFAQHPVADMVGLVARVLAHEFGDWFERLEQVGRVVEGGVVGSGLTVCEVGRALELVVVAGQLRAGGSDELVLDVLGLLESVDLLSVVDGVRERALARFVGYVRVSPLVDDVGRSDFSWLVGEFAGSSEGWSERYRRLWTWSRVKRLPVERVWQRLEQRMVELSSIDVNEGFNPHEVDPSRAIDIESRVQRSDIIAAVHSLVRSNLNAFLGEEGSDRQQEILEQILDEMRGVNLDDVSFDLPRPKLALIDSGTPQVHYDHAAMQLNVSFGPIDAGHRASILAGTMLGQLAREFSLWEQHVAMARLVSGIMGEQNSTAYAFGIRLDSDIPAHVRDFMNVAWENRMEPEERDSDFDGAVGLFRERYGSGRAGAASVRTEYSLLSAAATKAYRDAVVSRSLPGDHPFRTLLDEESDHWRKLSMGSPLAQLYFTLNAESHAHRTEAKWLEAGVPFDWHMHFVRFIRVAQDDGWLVDSFPAGVRLRRPDTPPMPFGLIPMAFPQAVVQLPSLAVARADLVRIRSQLDQLVPRFSPATVIWPVVTGSPVAPSTLLSIIEPDGPALRPLLVDRVEGEPAPAVTPAPVGLMPSGSVTFPIYGDVYLLPKQTVPVTADEILPAGWEVVAGPESAWIRFAEDPGEEPPAGSDRVYVAARGQAMPWAVVAAAYRFAFEYSTDARRIEVVLRGSEVEGLPDVPRAQRFGQMIAERHRLFVELSGGDVAERLVWSAGGSDVHLTAERLLRMLEGFAGLEPGTGTKATLLDFAKRLVTDPDSVADEDLPTMVIDAGWFAAKAYGWFTATKEQFKGAMRLMEAADRAENPAPSFVRMPVHRMIGLAALANDHDPIDVTVRRYEAVVQRLAQSADEAERHPDGKPMWRLDLAPRLGDLEPVPGKEVLVYHSDADGVPVLFGWPRADVAGGLLAGAAILVELVEQFRPQAPVVLWPDLMAPGSRMPAELRALANRLGLAIELEPLGGTGQGQVESASDDSESSQQTGADEPMELDRMPLIALRSAVPMTLFTAHAQVVQIAKTAEFKEIVSLIVDQLREPTAATGAFWLPKPALEVDVNQPDAFRAEGWKITIAGGNIPADDEVDAWAWDLVQRVAKVFATVEIEFAVARQTADRTRDWNATARALRIDPDSAGIHEHVRSFVDAALAFPMPPSDPDYHAASLANQTLNNRPPDLDALTRLRRAILSTVNRAVNQASARKTARFLGWAARVGQSGQWEQSEPSEQWEPSRPWEAPDWMSLDLPQPTSFEELFPHIDPADLELPVSGAGGVRLDADLLLAMLSRMSAELADEESLGEEPPRFVELAKHIQIIDAPIVRNGLRLAVLGVGLAAAMLHDSATANLDDLSAAARLLKWYEATAIERPVDVANLALRAAHDIFVSRERVVGDRLAALVVGVALVVGMAIADQAGAALRMATGVLRSHPHEVNRIAPANLFDGFARLGQQVSPVEATSSTPGDAGPTVELERLGVRALHDAGPNGPVELSSPQFTIRNVLSGLGRYLDALVPLLWRNRKAGLLTPESLAASLQIGAKHAAVFREQVETGDRMVEAEAPPVEELAEVIRGYTALLVHHVFGAVYGVSRPDTNRLEHIGHVAKESFGDLLDYLAEHEPAASDFLGAQAEALSVDFARMFYDLVPMIDFIERLRMPAVTWIEPPDPANPVEFLERVQLATRFDADDDLEHPITTIDYLMSGVRRDWERWVDQTDVFTDLRLEWPYHEDGAVLPNVVVGASLGVLKQSLTLDETRRTFYYLTSVANQGYGRSLIVPAGELRRRAEVWQTGATTDSRVIWPEADGPEPAVSRTLAAAADQLGRHITAVFPDTEAAYDIIESNLDSDERWKSTLFVIADDDARLVSLRNRHGISMIHAMPGSAISTERDGAWHASNGWRLVAFNNYVDDSLGKSLDAAAVVKAGTILDRIAAQTLHPPADTPTSGVDYRDRQDGLWRWTQEYGFVKVPDPDRRVVGADLLRLAFDLVNSTDDRAFPPRWSRGEGRSIERLEQYQRDTEPPRSEGQELSPTDDCLLRLLGTLLALNGGLPSAWEALGAVAELGGLSDAEFVRMVGGQPRSVTDPVGLLWRLGPGQVALLRARPVGGAAPHVFGLFADDRSPLQMPLRWLDSRVRGLFDRPLLTVTLPAVPMPDLLDAEGSGSVAEVLRQLTYRTIRTGVPSGLTVTAEQLAGADVGAVRAWLSDQGLHAQMLMLPGTELIGVLDAQNRPVDPARLQPETAGSDRLFEALVDLAPHGQSGLLPETKLSGRPGVQSSAAASVDGSDGSSVGTADLRLGLEDFLATRVRTPSTEELQQLHDDGLLNVALRSGNPWTLGRVHRRVREIAEQSGPAGLDLEGQRALVAMIVDGLLGPTGAKSEILLPEPGIVVREADPRPADYDPVRKELVLNAVSIESGADISALVWRLIGQVARVFAGFELEFAVARLVAGVAPDPATAARVLGIDLNRADLPAHVRQFMDAAWEYKMRPSDADFGAAVLAYRAQYGQNKHADVGTVLYRAMWSAVDQAVEEASQQRSEFFADDAPESVDGWMGDVVNGADPDVVSEAIGSEWAAPPSTGSVAGRDRVEPGFAGLFPTVDSAQLEWSAAGTGPAQVDADRILTMLDGLARQVSRSKDIGLRLVDLAKEVGLADWRRARGQQLVAVLSAGLIAAMGYDSLTERLDRLKAAAWLLREYDDSLLVTPAEVATMVQWYTQDGDTSEDPPFELHQLVALLGLAAPQAAPEDSVEVGSEYTDLRAAVRQSVGSAVSDPSGAVWWIDNVLSSVRVRPVEGAVVLVYPSDSRGVPLGLEGFALVEDAGGNLAGAAALMELYRQFSEQHLRTGAPARVVLVPDSMAPDSTLPAEFEGLALRMRMPASVPFTVDNRPIGGLASGVDAQAEERVRLHRVDDPGRSRADFSRLESQPSTAISEAGKVTEVEAEPLALWTLVERLLPAGLHPFISDRPVHVYLSGSFGTNRTAVRTRDQTLNRIAEAAVGKLDRVIVAHHPTPRTVSAAAGPGTGNLQWTDETALAAGLQLFVHLSGLWPVVVVTATNPKLDRLLDTLKVITVRSATGPRTDGVYNDRRVWQVKRSSTAEPTFTGELDAALSAARGINQAVPGLKRSPQLVELMHAWKPADLAETLRRHAAYFHRPEVLAELREMSGFGTKDWLDKAAKLQAQRLPETEIDLRLPGLYVLLHRMRSTPPDPAVGSAEPVPGNAYDAHPPVTRPVDGATVRGDLTRPTEAWQSAARVSAFRFQVALDPTQPFTLDELVALAMWASDSPARRVDALVATVVALKLWGLEPADEADRAARLAQVEPRIDEVSKQARREIGPAGRAEWKATREHLATWRAELGATHGVRELEDAIIRATDCPN